MTKPDDVAARLAQAVENVRPIVERERASEGRPCPVPLHVGGVGRVANSTDPPESFEHNWLQVYFNRRPSDDELRAFHAYVREFLVGGT